MNTVVNNVFCALLIENTKRQTNKCGFFLFPSQDSDYVIAERNFVTDDRSMLSFHKEDIIKLQVMDGLEKGYSYGCVVKKKVVFLEELKRDTQDFGECLLNPFSFIENRNTNMVAIQN
uniref:SH3 domain-containing protein n=1 Tax=Acanthochromis polyacanthus TaxID=80966 RepID=A0A3Q1F8E5_9TELE